MSIVLFCIPICVPINISQNFSKYNELKTKPREDAGVTYVILDASSLFCLLDEGMETATNRIRTH